MKIGYARVSTGGQDLTLQVGRLEAAGCSAVFRDHGASGAAWRRPQLGMAMAKLQAGDVLVVCSLDRLGRNLGHLIAMIDDLRRTGKGFVSLSDQVDTTTPQGELVFHVLGALAQFERALISERTAAGRAAARLRGVRFGRPAALKPEQIDHAFNLASDGKTFTEIAQLLGVSRPTVYRALRARLENSTQ